MRVVVVFEWGSRLKLAEVSRAAPRSGALALLTFGFAVGALALVSMLKARPPADQAAAGPVAAPAPAAAAVSAAVDVAVGDNPPAS